MICLLNSGTGSAAGKTSWSVPFFFKFEVLQRFSLAIIASDQVFEGHTHYVMQVNFNPKDSNTFASASLDRTIKIWSVGSGTAHYTLEGHDKGVNCVDYYFGGDKPYLVSGADDKLVKVWDYQNKACVQTLEGHTNNVTVVCFHPELPIIISGSEDGEYFCKQLVAVVLSISLGTVRVWHANTYRLENTLNYGMERVWTMAYMRGSNDVAFGYDEGTISIKVRHFASLDLNSRSHSLLLSHNSLDGKSLPFLWTTREKLSGPSTVKYRLQMSRPLLKKNLPMARELFFP
jgi:coatomer subunit beta'